MRPSNRLGRYHLGERLGEGGMAEVFRAEMPGAAGFRKAVAIKRVKPELAADQSIREAFLQEAQVARRMEHGGVVQVFDVGIEDGVPYLVIELVDGLSLDRVLARRARTGEPGIDVAAALYVIEHVAAALHHAHQLTDRSGRLTPVVHRDVNPRNILVSRDGVVKLTDFGIAKAWHLPSATLPGTVKGTLGYLSPEQAAGAPVDAHTDQFSTGVVLYELLAGDNPLAGTDSLHAYCRLLEEGLPRLRVQGPVDEALADIVARAVAVRPQERFPSMEDLRGELEAWRVARGIRASAGDLRRRVRALLGEASTGELAPVALGDVLQAQLDARGPDHGTQAHADTTALPASDHERGARAPGTARAPGRRAAVLALALAALAGGVALAWTRMSAPAPASVAQIPGAVAVSPVSARDAAAPGILDTAPAGGATAAPSPAAPSPSPSPTATLPVADAGAGRAVAPTRRRDAPARAAAVRDRPDENPQVGPRTAQDPPPGRVKINLIPYARVTVNGQARGQTPVDLTLPAGAHDLVLENPDTGQRRERQILVEPGQALLINQW